MSPRYSITRAYTPPVSSAPPPGPTDFEADSSSPQDLPGSLDYDSSSTRSISPEDVHPNSHIALARDISRAQHNEPTPPLVSYRET